VIVVVGVVVEADELVMVVEVVIVDVGVVVETNNGVIV
jgi:hypothetical protein